MKTKKIALLHDYIRNMSESKKRYLLEGMEYRKKILLLKNEEEEKESKKRRKDTSPY
jgi:hypothetical protein